ncbi:MAG: site-specific integrase, partial [Proteobacteria bacterium]|nr:site-specific integrase [Pseudomonadota bacterium]
GYKLREIQRPLVLKFRASMLDSGVSRRTINKALSLLGSLFRYAELNSQAHHNPCIKVMLPKAPASDVEYDDDEIAVLSIGEQRRLIKAANGRDRVLLMSALATGLRQGELLGLKWGDLDLKVGQLNVRRQFTRGAFAPLKTEFARRRIPLPKSLVQELRKWKLACPKGDHDLVFPNSLGRPESPANLLKRSYYPALRRAGIRRIRFHALRHSYVSTLIEYGVTNIKRLQMLLGHSSAMITLDTYAHLLPDSDDGIATASEAALFGSGSKTVAVDSKADAEASAST